MSSPLNQDFFARGTPRVARELVGCVLQVTGLDHEEVSGRIVEAEAYEGENDPASHAGRGRTPRSAIMFGRPGIAYVYIIYGVHHCLNFVTEDQGTPGAVLIRSLEPLAGRQIMARRRGLDGRTIHDRDLCAGPGRLCQALGIDREWNGAPLVAEAPGSDFEFPGQIRVFPGSRPWKEPLATPRIGISRAVDRQLRFIDPESACISAFVK